MRYAGESMTNPPIGDYALIGDCRGAGLVSRDGLLDWLCVPRFNSPSIFAVLLDAETGGRFRIRPSGEFTAMRRYFPDTNILETTSVRCPIPTADHRLESWVMDGLQQPSRGHDFYLDTLPLCQPLPVDCDVS